MLDPKVPFKITDLKNAYNFIYSLDKRKLVYLYAKGNNITSIVVHITVYNLLHLTGLSYYNNFYNSPRFIQDLRRNKLNIRQLGEKDDGTTRLKLPLLPLLNYIVCPGVKVSDNRIVLDGHSFESSLLVKRSFSPSSSIMLGEDSTNPSQKFLYPESLYSYQSIGPHTKKKIGNTCNVLSVFSPSDENRNFMSVYFVKETSIFNSETILTEIERVNKKLQ